MKLVVAARLTVVIILLSFATCKDAYGPPPQIKEAQSKLRDDARLYSVQFIHAQEVGNMDSVLFYLGMMKANDAAQKHISGDD